MVNFIKSIFLSGILLIFFSCGDNLDKWKKLEYNDDAVIEDFIEEFGKPIDTTDLFNLSIKNIRNIEKEYLFVDVFNPELQNVSDKNSFEKHKIKFEKEFKKDSKDFIKLTYSMESIDRGRIFHDSGEFYHSCKYLGDDFDNTIKKIVGIENVNGIICKGCSKLISLRKKLESYVYITTKEEWINSVLRYYPMDSIYSWNNNTFPSMTDNYVNSRDIEEGVRYSFLLETDINNPRNEGIQKVDVLGNFEKRYEEHRTGKYEIITKELEYLVTNKSKELIDSYLSNTDWVFGDKDSPISAIRLNDDKTFSYSMKNWSCRGNWGIGSEGDVFLNKTWTSNGEGYNRIWLHVLSKSKIMINNSDTVYDKI